RFFPWLPIQSPQFWKNGGLLKWSIPFRLLKNKQKAPRSLSVDPSLIEKYL
ncbi:MAG: hypothetical protein ACI9OT_001969, partial [Gammaproteobacteria bacterium]